jgi:hypothetical protein
MLPTEIHDLVQAAAGASPDDSGAQAELLDRLNAMRELMRQGGQPDLAAYLEAASLATEMLATTGGPTPERIAKLVVHLVERVETAFQSIATTDKGLRKLPVCLDETPDSVLLRTVNSQRLGEILVHHGRITREQIDEALRAQRATGMRFGEALVMLGVATWEDIHHAIRFQERDGGHVPVMPAKPERGARQRAAPRVPPKG